MRRWSSCAGRSPGDRELSSPAAAAPPAGARRFRSSRTSTGARAPTTAASPGRTSVDAVDGRPRGPVRARGGGARGWPARSCCRSPPSACCTRGDPRAVRGARRARGQPRRRRADRAERVALGLLGDLVDHRARELHARTGLVLERGRLGVWLVGEAGALLVRPGGRRVHCYCVKATDSNLPPSDRLAHLLLALRADEVGLRDRRQPGVLGGALAAAPPAGGAGAGGAGGRGARRAGPLRPRGSRRSSEVCTWGQCGRAVRADHSRHDPSNHSLEGPAGRRPPDPAGEPSGHRPFAATGWPGCASTRRPAAGEPRFEHLKRVYD